MLTKTNESGFGGWIYVLLLALIASSIVGIGFLLSIFGSDGEYAVDRLLEPESTFEFVRTFLELAVPVASNRTYTIFSPMP